MHVQASLVCACILASVLCEDKPCMAHNSLNSATTSQQYQLPAAQMQQRQPDREHHTSVIEAVVTSAIIHSVSLCAIAPVVLHRKENPMQLSLHTSTRHFRINWCV